MKLDVGTKFSFLDEREVPCPFFEEPRLVFRIARIGNAGYQEAVADARAKMEAALKRSTKTVLDASAQAEMLAAVRNLRGKAHDEFVTRKTEELVGELARGSETTDEAMEAFLDQTDRAEAIAEYLITNIDGLRLAETKEPIPYSVEAGITLLRYDVPFNEHYEDGDFELTEGMTLGEAVRQWVLHEASKAEKYRSDYVETAKGN